MLKISIHAPRTGSDYLFDPRKGGGDYFNPRSPHGERPVVGNDNYLFIIDFNPRSPHGERPVFPGRAPGLI